MPPTDRLGRFSRAVDRPGRYKVLEITRWRDLGPTPPGLSKEEMVARFREQRQVLEIRGPATIAPGASKDIIVHLP